MKFKPRFGLLEEQGLRDSAEQWGLHCVAQSCLGRVEKPNQQLSLDWILPLFSYSQSHFNTVSFVCVDRFYISNSCLEKYSIAWIFQMYVSKNNRSFWNFKFLCWKILDRLEILNSCLEKYSIEFNLAASHWSICETICATYTKLLQTLGPKSLINCTNWTMQPTDKAKCPTYWFF